MEQRRIQFQNAFDILRFETYLLGYEGLKKTILSFISRGHKTALVLLKRYGAIVPSVWR